MVGIEQERLKKRLFEDPSRKLLNFGITPGDNPFTAEELCGEINKAMDQVEDFRSLPVEEQMRRQMADVYERLSRAIQLCKFSARDWDKPVEDARGRLSDIFGELDMSLLTLGNWIDHKERLKIKARARSGETF